MLKQETSFVDTIKFRRFVNSALKLLLQQPVLDELKVRSDYEYVDMEVDETTSFCQTVSIETREF